MPAIDLSYLRNLIGDDADLEHELLLDFIKDAGHQIEILESQKNEPSITSKWYSAAHSLKNLAHNIGASALSACAEDCQKEDLDNSQNKNDLYQKLAEEYKVLLLELEDYLNENKS